LIYTTCSDRAPFWGILPAGTSRNGSPLSTCGVFSGQKSTSSSLYVIFKRFSMGDTRSSGKDKSEDDIKEVGFARIFGGAP
jgi:hypothetical protein